MSGYLHQQYDPEIYLKRILDAIDDARKNGLRIDYYDGIIEIENTVSRDTRIIDLNKEFGWIV